MLVSKASFTNQNFKQFNGYNACDFCLHTGDISIKKKTNEKCIQRRRFKEKFIRHPKSDGCKCSQRQTCGWCIKNTSINNNPRFCYFSQLPSGLHARVVFRNRQLCRIWFETPSPASYIKGEISCMFAANILRSFIRYKSTALKEIS